MYEYYEMAHLLLQESSYKNDNDILFKIYKIILKNFYIRIENYVFDMCNPNVEVPNDILRIRKTSMISRFTYEKFFKGEYELSFTNTLKVSSMEGDIIDFPLYDSYPFKKLHKQTVVNINFDGKIIRLLNVLHLCRYSDVITYILNQVYNFNILMDLLKLGLYVMDNHTILNVLSLIDKSYLNEEKAVYLWEFFQLYFDELPHPCIEDCTKIAEIIYRIRKNIIHYMDTPNIIKYCNTDVDVIKSICNNKCNTQLVNQQGIVFPSKLKYCHFYAYKDYKVYHAVRRDPLILTKETKIILSKEQHIIEFLHSVMKLDIDCTPYDIYLSWKNICDDKYCDVTKACLQYIAYDFKHLHSYDLHKIPKHDFIQLIQAMPISKEIETIKMCSIIMWCNANNEVQITSFTKCVNMYLIDIEQLKQYKEINSTLAVSFLSFICTSLSYQYNILAQDICDANDMDGVNDIMKKRKSLISMNLEDFVSSANKRQKH